MARIAAVVPDLMLQSRVVELLRPAGHQVSIAAGPDKVPDDTELIVADVGEVDPGVLASRGVPVLGFHQHTDPETAERARAAGVATVVPRSRLVRELPHLVESLLD